MITDKERIERLKEALLAYDRFNLINNDTEAYLAALAEWALGYSEEKPIASDYGVSL